MRLAFPRSVALVLISPFWCRFKVVAAAVRLPAPGGLEDPRPALPSLRLLGHRLHAEVLRPHRHRHLRHQHHRVSDLSNGRFTHVEKEKIRRCLFFDTYAHLPRPCFEWTVSRLRQGHAAAALRRAG